jgi:pyridoxamine 5'-phosphate oxidase
MPDSKEQQQRIGQIRRDFAKEELRESVVKENPIRQFSEWFDQALKTDLLDVNAMSLSTVSEEGIPSSRIVLLKGIDEHGFQFYTNYNSRKGRELQQNPHAALCLYWAPLERQIRIEGKVEKLGRKQSRDYFHQRPRLSQLGAWASEQSSRIESRSALEEQFRSIKHKFEGEEVPLPDFWGGFLLSPNRIEFWQGRPGRLHDRICYEKAGTEWNVFRLSP